MNDETNRNPSNEPRIDAEEILAGVLEWVGIESPSNARRPVRHSKSTHPKAQTSTRRSIGLPRACSGAM